MAARCMYYDLYGSLKTLEVLAPEGHAHAARAAAAAGELGGGHDEKVQALLVQHVVGDGVAGVDADLAGLDAQGVGAVVPLLAGGRDRCLLYTSPSPRDLSTSRMPSSA